jgi:mannitol operon transcriptional antiterminator
MNNLTPRQQFILSKVLNQGPFNVKGLDKQLDISTRTILREISSINKYLKEYSVNIFNDEDMNLSISGNRKSIEKIKISLNSIPIQWLFSKEQRQIVIACELLTSKEPLKASYFSHKFNVVMGSISFDLDNIEKVLIVKNLCLIRKRTYGVSVEGIEWNKRNALVELFFDFKPFEDLLAFLYDEKIDQAIKLLFDIVFGSELIGTVKMILKHSSLSYFRKNDVKYLSLFLQIILCIKKTESGDNLVLPDKVKEDIKLLDDYKKIKVLDEILKDNNINLPDDELVYLCLHLGDYRYLLNKNNSFTESDIDFKTISKEVVAEVSNKMHIDISKDEELVKDLSQHIRQTFYVLNLGIKVINPLINEIKEHYPKLFKVINNICRLIFSRYNLKIPDEEVGYITMHIDVAIQRQQAILKKIKVLIVCPGGIGTARILCSKIQSIFPDIGSLSVGSLHNVGETVNNDKYDLVLSTVPISYKTSDNVIEVSPFLTKENIEKINDFIFNFKVNNQEKLMEVSSKSNSNNITDDNYELVNTILKNFRLIKTRVNSFADLIDFIVNDIYKIDATINKDVIKNLIFKREEKGNVVVPGTHIALIHTRSDDINIPFLGVYRIDKPFGMSSIGFTIEDVDTFLVMIARNNESNYILQILGKISIALIEKKEFIEVLKLSNVIDIRNYLINIVNKEEEY